MRTIANLIRIMKLNNNKTHSGFDFCKNMYEHLNELRPFVYNLQHDYVNNFNDKDFYLPFKFCSFDFLYPGVGPDVKESLSIFRSLYKKKEFSGNIASLERLKSPVFVGTIVRENDDLSLSEVLVWGDEYYRASNQKQNISNLNKAFDWPLLMGLKHPNYTDFKSTYSYGLLKALHNKELSYGETIRSFGLKRNGLAPDLVKKIIVVDNTQCKQNKYERLGEVDWRHSWSVMGHWRKTSNNTLGKDRSGQYIVPGHTWVKDYLKGSGEFINKTRIIKEATNELL